MKQRRNANSKSVTGAPIGIFRFLKNSSLKTTVAFSGVHDLFMEWWGNISLAPTILFNTTLHSWYSRLTRVLICVHFAMVLFSFFTLISLSCCQCIRQPWCHHWWPSIKQKYFALLARNPDKAKLSRQNKVYLATAAHVKIPLLWKYWPTMIEFHNSKQTLRRKKKYASIISFHLSFGRSWKWNLLSFWSGVWGGFCFCVLLDCLLNGWKEYFIP